MAGKKKFSDQIIAAALAKYGGNADSAAAEIGCSTPIVYAYKRRHGMGQGRRGRPRMFADETILAAIIAQEGDMKAVAQALRCSVMVIYRYLARSYKGAAA